MKYHIAVLLFLLLVSVKVNSQGGWYPLQSGETEHIISIQFIDAQTGYYISTSNACFRTTNGGAQWNLVEIFSSGISDMKFLNAATGYVTACGGNVYRTTNSGIEWNAYNTGTSYCFSSITFLNSLTGWIAAYAGGNVATIFKTLNGGVNWFFLSTVTGIENVYRIQFTDVQTGMIGGGRNNDYDGVFLRTTNGGANWISLLPTAEVIDDFVFVNPQTGWAISGGDVLRSTNGGINWIGQVHVTGHFSDCLFIDVNTGWAQGLTGSDGIIYKTTIQGSIGLHKPRPVLIICFQCILLMLKPGGQQDCWAKCIKLPPAATSLQAYQLTMKILRLHICLNKITRIHLILLQTSNFI